MYIVPVVLLVVLIVVVISANSMKKKGSMTESAYGNLVSILSVVVTVAALVVLFMRLRG
jgi:uncharacterized protein YybS (DUF2232 family)